MKPNPQHLAEVAHLISQGPYFELLGLKVTKLELGHSLIEVDIDHKHMNCFGGMHGGAYESIMDTAAYWALYAEMPEDSGAVTLDLDANLIRTVQEGTHVRCEGSVIKKGNTVSIGEAKMYDDEGRLLGSAISKILATPGLQPISAAVAALDPTLKLSPKFIEG